MKRSRAWLLGLILDVGMSPSVGTADIFDGKLRRYVSPSQPLRGDRPYRPHQGLRERARRLRQMAAGQLRDRFGLDGARA